IEAECALLGGETAILPDFYKPGHYDLAGFCVGVVERKAILKGKEIVPGDKIIAMASSGLHSNGYSLARKIAFDVAGLKPEDHVPELGRSIGDELLEPTRIYVRALKLIYKHYQVKQVIHGIAHITGGGMLENPPRILPDGCAMRISRCWDVPPIFSWLQKTGNVRQEEMDRVFNMGIGMVLVVSPYYAESILRTIREEAKISAWIVGDVVKSPEKTVEYV
ncbi:MAG: phosphoribosylformylglycinamidine cyclo-ligase, partial [bacterium]